MTPLRFPNRPCYPRGPAMFDDREFARQSRASSRLNLFLASAALAFVAALCGKGVFF